MWERKELKSRGKAAFKKNYWPCVLAALILAVLYFAEIGISHGGSNNSTVNTNTTESVQQSAPDIEVNVQDFSDVQVNIKNLQQEIQDIQYNGPEAQVFVGMLAGVTVFGIVAAVCFNIFVKNMFVVGAFRYFVKNGTEEKPPLNILVSAYSDGKFINVFLTMLLNNLFIGLWTCLFVIPGIIKFYSYRMVPYILADQPDLKPLEVITKSRQMMKGQKWKAFVLDLSFIGWYILSSITGGILGVFYVNPYRQATNAELYLALRK